MIQRTQSEIVLLFLSALGAITIYLFAIMRLANDEIVVAIIDVIIASILFAFFLFVFITRKVDIAKFALSIFLMVAVVLQVHLQGASAIHWFYPSMLIVYYLTSPKSAVKICCLSTPIIFALLFPLISLVDFILILVTTLLTNIFSFVIFHSYHKTQIQLKLLATTDPLTQVGNRRALNRDLSDLIISQQREKYVMCLILFDLDFFKKINDNYGHAVGDEILISVCKLVVKNTRVFDTLYRYGGEEFIILPLKVDLLTTATLAEKLRFMVESHQYPLDVHVTISLGVAQYQSGETSQEWIRRADSALYLAKSTGRNKVCLADH